MNTDLTQFHLTLDQPDDVGWQYLRQYLPPDRDASARKYGAFLVPRTIPDADTLLRLLLAYACGPSLQEVTHRACELHLVEHLAAPSLDERFRKMVPWLSYLLGQMLAGAPTAFPWGRPLHLRILDASVLCRPGVTQPDWRLHLGLDLRTGLIDHISVTGANIGERLADYPVEAGDVVIVDRVYATRAGICALDAQQAYVLVRFTCQNLPLQHRDGRPFDLPAALHQLSPGTQGCWEVQTAPAPGHPAVPGRLVVQALPEAQANAARRRVRQAASKRGKTPDALTLLAAGFVLVFTTVPVEWLTPAEVLAIYRMRWQVEIAFKRGKSGLTLADIRAQTDALCYAVLLAKCLLLLLVEKLARITGVFSPSGHLSAADEPLPVLPCAVCHLGDDPVAPADAGRMAVAASRCVDCLFYTAAPQAAGLAA